MRRSFIYAILIVTICLVSCNQDDKEIPGPTIYLSMPDGGFDLDKDSSFVISPQITYDLSSTYSWQLNGETFFTEKDYTFEDYSFGDYNLLFSVETPNGRDTMTIPVHVYDIFTFEETDTLNDKGYFNNPENGLFTFEHISLTTDYIDEESENWSGFAMSENTNKSNSSIENQFSVYASSESTSIFSVYKQSDEIDHKILFTDGQPHIINSIDVNNSTYAYLNMYDQFDKKSSKDYFCLTAIGYDASGSAINSVEFYLADYRFDTLSERYIVTTWSTFDLTSLGAVYAVGFKLTSSLDDDTELQLPKYFCLDNIKLRS